MGLTEDRLALQELRIYMEFVAVILGDDWTFEPSKYDDTTYHVGTLVGPGAKYLSVTRTTWGHDAGRLTIRAEYDGLLRPGQPFYGAVTHEDIRNALPYDADCYPSITVAPTRDAASVARDITRRLLPRYEPLLQRVKTRLTATLDYRKQGRALADTLAQQVNGTVRDDGTGTYTVRLYNGTTANTVGALWGDIRVSGDKANITLHNLTADQTIALLSAIGARGE
jgi:hypothetical protein